MEMVATPPEAAVILAVFHRGSRLYAYMPCMCCASEMNVVS